MVKSKKKLLWVLHDGNYSGANMALEEYFNVLSEMGYDLLVISPFKGTFVARLLEQGIETKVIPMYPWTRALDEGFFIKDWLRRFVRNTLATFQISWLALKVDKICTNTLCVISGAIAAKLVRKPHYLFVHEFGEEDHGFSLAIPQQKAYELLFNLSNKIVLNSQSIKDKWVGVLKSDSKLELLYNVVENKSIQGFSKFKELNTTGHFLMLGQISEGKGHLLAINALSEVRKTFPHVKLDIVGSIPDNKYKEKLEKEIQSIGATDFITIKSSVDNPYKIFSKYSSLLMCSRMEAFGRVTVEALQSGLPVIAANKGGSLEIVNDGENGLLFKSGSSESLTCTINKFLKLNNIEIAKMKAQAVLIHNVYNKKKASEQLKKIFENES